MENLKHYCKCHLVAVNYSLMPYNIQYEAQFSIGRRCINYFCTKIIANYNMVNNQIPHLLVFGL